VPCLIGNDGATRNYAPFTPKLGKKASHGCIRVQNKENEQGMNMKWLWDHLKADQPNDYLRTRVLIWDDVGRILDIMDPLTPMYYNPKGGQYYHVDQYCYSVKDRYLPLTETPYESLDGEFIKLKPCTTCGAPQRISQLDSGNLNDTILLSDNPEAASDEMCFIPLWEKNGWDHVHEFLDDIPPMEKGRIYCFRFALTDPSLREDLSFAIFTLAVMLLRQREDVNMAGCECLPSHDGQNHFALLVRK
jgi:hypothetical protein